MCFTMDFANFYVLFSIAINLQNKANKSWAEKTASIEFFHFSVLGLEAIFQDG